MKGILEREKEIIIKVYKEFKKGRVFIQKVYLGIINKNKLFLRNDNQTDSIFFIRNNRCQ